MIIFGTRIFGVTDTVPNVFHVGTKFFHIDFLPLVPLHTYLMIYNSRTGRAEHAIEIPIDCKSIGMAWLRCISGMLVIGSIIAFVISCSMYSDAKEEQQYSDKYNKTPNIFEMIFPSLIILLVAIGLAYLAFCHGITRNASYERASELVTKHLAHTPLGPRIQDLVDRHFDKIPTATVLTTVMTDDDDEHDNVMMIGVDGMATSPPAGASMATPTEEDLSLVQEGSDTNNKTREIV